MELIKVNTAKLKIILTASDFSRYSLDAQSFDYDTPRSKKIFRDILDLAKKQADFHTQGCKICVEYYPSCDGGAELYITRKFSPLPPCNGEKKKYLVSLPSLDSVIALCQKLYKDGFDGNSTLYSHDEKYILMLEFSCSGFEYISEYGRVFSSNELRLATLNEHGRIICQGSAIKIFAEKFLKPL